MLAFIPSGKVTCSLSRYKRPYFTSILLVCFPFFRICEIFPQPSAALKNPIMSFFSILGSNPIIPFDHHTNTLVQLVTLRKMPWHVHSGRHILFRSMGYVSCHHSVNGYLYDSQTFINHVTFNHFSSNLIFNTSPHLITISNTVFTRVLAVWPGTNK